MRKYFGHQQEDCPVQPVLAISESSFASASKLAELIYPTQHTTIQSMHTDMPPMQSCGILLSTAPKQSILRV